MTSPAWELQVAVVAALKADADVTALVNGKIFDRVPEAEASTYPRITIGPADEFDSGSDCKMMSDHSLQLDVWSIYQGGAKECKAINFAVARALNGIEVDLPTHGLLDIRVVSRRSFLDPDGKTTHGVIVIEAEIEEN